MCLDILLQCTNLVAAKFISMQSWVQRPLSTPIIVLRQLELLALIFLSSDDDHVMPFFTRLDLPALTDLDVKFGVSWCSADFTSFQRCSPHIQRLALKHCSSLSPHDLKVILASSAQLVQLELYLCRQCIDNTVLEFLR